MRVGRSHWLMTGLFLFAVTFSSAAQRTARKPAQPQAPPVATTAATNTNSPVAVDWDTLKPENEDFSILMPKDTATEIGKFDYHKFELNTRLYMSAPTTGPVVGVASMSGIKSNPGSTSDFERFNSYADAFKVFFPPKVRKDAVPKMVLVSTKSFHGYTGRVYKLTVGELSGTVNAYVTKKRFYAIAILNSKKDDALEEKFLSSFVIPDKPVEQPQVTAAEETQTQGEVANANGQSQRAQRRSVSPEGGATIGNPSTSVQVNTQEDSTEFGNGTVQANANAQTNPTQQQNQNQNQKRAPINGGVLNGKAIYLPVPEMPAGEKASGIVMVQVLVDEQGSVVDAKAVSGPPALYPSAVNAARFARFAPTMLMGEPVRVQGTLAYNFAKTN